MKVKDLIFFLQGHSPELEVMHESETWGTFKEAKAPLTKRIALVEQDKLEGKIWLEMKELTNDDKIIEKKTVVVL